MARTKKSRHGWAPWWSSTLQPSGTTAAWGVLLIKGYAVAVELGFVPVFKCFVRKYLFTKGVTTSHDIWTVGHALWLHVNSSDASVSSMARAIIEDFSEFKTFDRQIFNKKAGCVNFQQALGNLKCDPSRPPHVHHIKAEGCYIPHTLPTLVLRSVSAGNFSIR